MGGFNYKCIYYNNTWPPSKIVLYVQIKIFFFHIFRIFPWPNYTPYSQAMSPFPMSVSQCVRCPTYYVDLPVVQLSQLSRVCVHLFGKYTVYTVHCVHQNRLDTTFMSSGWLQNVLPVSYFKIIAEILRCVSI